MLFWLYVFALASSRTLISATNAAHRLTLDANTTFFWVVDYQSQQIDVEVHTRSNKSASEWLAIGFSDYGALTPADLCVYWVDWKGRSFMEDAWVDNKGNLKIDQRQDCKGFKTLRKNNNETVVFFYSRKFDTCDNVDYIIEDGTTHIVWARGNGPLFRLDGLNLKSASSSGFERTTLLTNDNPIPIPPPDTWNLDVTVHNFNVPATETTYWCTVMQLPAKLAKKHHVIQTEPLFESVGSTLIHHMEIFHCNVKVGELIPAYAGPCESARRPMGTKVCSQVLGAWAMGAPKFTYPKEAGLAIGGPNFNSFVMLEVHYHNPELESNVVDSSGFRLLVTPTLRDHDAGVMELGQEYNDKFAIPPGQTNFRLSGFCNNACTAVGLPENGITVFASQLHTHLTGVRVYTKHVRSGVELPELNRDNHFNQNFQEIRRLKTPVKIMPGDALITTCEYTTTDRDNVTLTGFSITDEMCVNYIHYYPRTQLEVCKSSIPDAHLRDYFDHLAVWDRQDTAEKGQGISAKYKAIQWTPARTMTLQRLYQSTPISMQCNQSTGERFPGGWEALPQPRIHLANPKPPKDCGTYHRRGM